MYVIRQGPRVSVSTPAKLNLFLELSSRRADGFHELETLMTPINLYDQVMLRGRFDGQIKLHCEWAAGYSEANGGVLPSPTENIAYKAASLLKLRAGVDQGADIWLLKRIPSQAGMGGGSSDAMATLVAANSAWQLGWSREQLTELGAELGSDVPFFAYGNLARCTGRGEKIESLTTRGRMHFVVVKPDFGLSTPDVFRQAEVPSRPVSSRSLRTSLASMDLRLIGDSLYNRLQVAAGSLTAWISEIGNAMRGLSVLGHQMSGSGTSYFALCRNQRHARLIAAKLRAVRLGQVFAVSSLGLSPTL